MRPASSDPGARPTLGRNVHGGEAPSPARMVKKQKGAGFQQAAGLIRYFDAEEETALHIDPRLVMVSAFLIGVVVLVVNALYPLA